MVLLLIITIFISTHKRLLQYHTKMCFITRTKSVFWCLIEFPRLCRARKTQLRTNTLTFTLHTQFLSTYSVEN